MSLFKKFLSNKKTSKSEFGQVDPLYVYIECSNCESKLKLFINKNTDLQNQYKSSSEPPPHYILKKEAMDDKCFKMITIEIGFDADKNIVSKDIENGKFITEEEFTS